MCEKEDIVSLIRSLRRLRKEVILSRIICWDMLRGGMQIQWGDYTKYDI